MCSRTTVEKLMFQAVEELKTCQACRLCSFGYFHNDAEKGYCWYTPPMAPVQMHPLVVDEIHTCPNWKQK